MTEHPRRGRLRRWGALASALIETARGGRPDARAVAIADSRRVVRVLFLASAVRAEVLPYLRVERTVGEIAMRIGAQRTDRLLAWLGVGVDLGELGQRGDTYRVSGRRARALADGDELLVAHYRSMLEYQVGPYADLDALLDDESDGGRDDLTHYADDIARVSLAAAPFVATMLRRVVAEVRPATVVDAGCGSGEYTRTVLLADPEARVDAIDLSADVVALAGSRLADAGLASRARLHTGDAEEWLAAHEGQCDLVLLLNNVYYFDPARRPALYEHVARALTNDGEMVLVTMTVPGSVAAAHLDFMLRCQRGHAALPRLADLTTEIAAAGFAVLEADRLVPTEPFVGIRARRVR